VSGVEGAIDTSFGDGGVVTFFGLTPSQIASAGAVAVDADSRIVIVGSTTKTLVASSGDSAIDVGATTTSRRTRLFE